jgi:hypothetical protein
MDESLEDAMEEIKRVDHLFYVSLKYTRTVDMMRTMVGRLISTFDFGMMSLLDHSKAKKKIKEIPLTPISKCELLNEVYTEDIKKYIDMYLLFRKLVRMPYTKREEYRRHVTMTSQLGDQMVETNIDILEEYYAKTKEFLLFVREIVRSKK